MTRHGRVDLPANDDHFNVSKAGCQIIPVFLCLSFGVAVNCMRRALELDQNMPIPGVMSKEEVRTLPGAFPLNA